MAASLGSDSPPATARSSSPLSRQLPTDETIENVIERATANARAANGGRSPVIGRDTRTQLFVGNLPYRVRWQDLKDLFRKAGGTVLRADVCLGPDNRSRGYGTVLLASAEDAGRAIDMFNGYVWQTRSLEVRPDRLPNDFDSSGGVGGSINKLSLGLSPQPTHYPTSLAAPSAIHMSSPPPPTTLPSLPSTNPANAIGHSTLGMTTTGIPSVFSQDSSNFTADALRTSLAAEMTRSPSAIKLPPTSSTQFDTMAISSSGQAPTSLNHSNIAPTVGFGSSDPARRTVYVANWPSQYGKSELEQIFRTVGNIVKSELLASNGSDNLGYGTVVYSTEDEAKNAVAQLNGLELNGRSLRLQIGKTEPRQLPLASSDERRKSDELASAMTIPNGQVTNVGTETAYPYASYMHMTHPSMSTGYILSSPPGSPYDQYPQQLAYMSVSTSPKATYPPPLNNGGMYPYAAWQHQPHGPPSPPTAPQNSSVSGKVSSNTTSNGAAGTGGPSTSNTAGTSTSRVPPGPINLPSPSITGYPPASISPMHHPPITPSIPSFTFVNHPMPTPPLHSHFLSPGVSTYSPLGSPGFYRAVNPYFNLSPGPPVHYHHDANAIASNGVIGSGVNGMVPSGQVTTPYFDMTAATAGSEAPQEYFPPMPSLTSAMHAMHLSSTNPNSSGNTSENESKPSVDEDAAQPFLEPVGIGRDGFPSLSAKPSEYKATDGVSRNGLTDWVTTPDDLPGSGSKEITPNALSEHSRTQSKSVLESTSVPNERASSADPSGKSTTPASSVAATSGSTSPGRTGPLFSSGKKPKLNLGSIPGFSPPARMMSGYTSMMANTVHSTVVANRAAQDQYRNGAATVLMGLNGATPTSRGNGTPNGREALVDHETASHRRNSWTEDNTRRQSISNELQVGNGESGYVR